jgi:guanine deaminase
MTQAKAYRAAILHSLGDPSVLGLDNSYAYYPDGILLVEQGHIRDIGPAPEVLARWPDSLAVSCYSDKLITAGFIDTHLHYPQTEIIASYGEQLLDWLNHYAFPEEAKFADPAHAHCLASFFLDELLRNGTTTALVFATVHKASIDAFFSESERCNMRMITGKVLMDRNAPAHLLDTVETGYTESKALIERWHQCGRQLYALTPRFAPTSSREQLAMTGRLLQEHEGLYLQTHLSENKQEVNWVKSLFPERSGYLDVYDHFGLLGKRSIFAHALHLEPQEWQRVAETDSVLAFCPSSNLFLGSGLFQLERAQQQQIRVGLGTDVGAGTSFSMLTTLAEAYKVQQLQAYTLHPLQALYLATLGGAKALSLDDKIGNLAVGKEADFLVLDLQATPLIEKRMANAQSLLEQLFILIMLGDDRVIAETYIYGTCQYRRA